jgi:hypothetical protein
MRRILLSCAILGVALLPAAASASARGHSPAGFVVVRQAKGDGGVSGKPVVTLVVHGFVLGRVSQEAVVDVFHLSSAPAPAVSRPAISHTAVRWNGLSGTEFRGSGFSFRAMGGFYRVVVRGAGIYLFAGGRHGTVWLHGSSVKRSADGHYSLDGGAWRSLPPRTVKRGFG